MQAVCAWCKQDLGRGDGKESTAVSHGICARCAELLERFDQVQLGSFLDRIAHPVLCVDGDVRVLFGNRAAATALGQPAASMRGRLGGEVVQCVHASEPGGCGHTPSCTACVIRGSVGRTHATGTPVRGAEAWQDVFAAGGGVTRQHLRVSTEKSGRFVLLHIDQVAAV